MLTAQAISSGTSLDICFLLGDARCTALNGMLDYINSRNNPEDAAQDLREILDYIADHAERAPRSYFERMVNRERVWCVRKARLRIYGFLSGRTLLLCTHDDCKRQRSADQRLLDRTERLRDEWEAQDCGPGRVR